MRATRGTRANDTRAETAPCQATPNQTSEILHASDVRDQRESERTAQRPETQEAEASESECTLTCRVEPANVALAWNTTVWPCCHPSTAQVKPKREEANQTGVISLAGSVSTGPAATNAKRGKEAHVNKATSAAASPQKPDSSQATHALYKVR